MPAPDRIDQLVDRFHRRRDEYRRGTYNETQARVELINPLFEELGWDIDHKRGGVREVKHEDRVEVAGKAKAPDYGRMVDPVSSPATAMLDQPDSHRATNAWRPQPTRR